MYQLLCCVFVIRRNAEREESQMKRIVTKAIITVEQWRREGVRGGSVVPGGHLQGRHFDPLIIKW